VSKLDSALAGWRPRRSQAVLAQPFLDGSAVLFDAGAGIAYALTSSAWLVWQSLDGDARMPDLVERLADCYAAPRAVLCRDVMALLRDLQTKGLIERDAGR
jgi:hypothetical protein